MSDSRQEIGIMLRTIEEQIATLRVEFEQYFAGVIRFQPEKLKNEVERNLRNLSKAPLKNSELNFRARALRYRFNSLDSYWRRVLREKEEGRYHKDLFKLRFRNDQKLNSGDCRSKQALAERQIKNIYEVYSRALAENGAKEAEISLEAFRSVLSQRASALKSANPGKKINFSIVLKNGIPTVEASVRE